jgi:hypothetical protein
MMLKTKISIAIFVFTSVIYFLISAYSYKVVKTELFGELKERLKNISYTGAFIINNKIYSPCCSFIARFRFFKDFSRRGFCH